MSTAGRRGPLLAAGLLLGTGLGGFVDGIVFHQLLQWHNMLSARLPPDTLVNAKINMFWDGVFHAAMWAVTLAGVVLLFRAGHQAGVRWSGALLSGGMLIGWGLFNLVEGLVNHQLLQLHHVADLVLTAWPADALFLASGVVLALLGGLLARR